MTTSTAYGPRVNILKKIKVGGSWRFAPLKQDAQNRISWNVVFINGLDEIHKEGSFYIEWYENGRRKRESVGKRPHESWNEPDEKGWCWTASAPALRSKSMRPQIPDDCRPPWLATSTR